MPSCAFWVSQSFHVATQLYMKTWTGDDNASRSRQATQTDDKDGAEPREGVSGASTSAPSDGHRGGGSDAQRVSGDDGVNSAVKTAQTHPAPVTLPEMKSVVQYRARVLREAMRKFVEGYREGVQDELNSGRIAKDGDGALGPDDEGRGGQHRQQRQDNGSSGH